MDCPACNHSNSRKHKFCSECGSDLRASQDALVDRTLIEGAMRQVRRSSSYYAVVTILFAVLAGGIAFFYLSTVKYRQTRQQLANMAASLSAESQRHQTEREALEKQAEQLRLLGATKQISAAELQPFIAKELRALLEDRLKDQKLLQLETADQTVKDITERTKDLFYWMGIPVAVVLGVFGFFGIKSYEDFRNRLDDAQSRLQVHHAALRRDANVMLEKAAADTKKAMDEVVAVGKKQVEESLTNIKMRMDEALSDLALASSQLVAKLGEISAAPPDAPKSKVPE